MKPIDPLQLQRLVDGELDQPQIQQVLAEAKAAPEQWQAIAVGFVENQIWDRAFQADNLVGSVTPTASAPVVENFAAGKDPSQKTTRVHEPIHPRSNYSWLVLAASLLAAATIGYMVNQIQNRNVPSSNIAEKTSPISEPLIANKSPDNNSAAPQITPASLQPDYHLEVPQDNEHLRDVMAAGPVAPVPLYRIGNVEQLEQFKLQRQPSELPPEIVQRLNGSGYQMQQDINFISGRLGDGRAFVVPVRTIRFLPGQ